MPPSLSLHEQPSADGCVSVAGVAMHADASGALYWAEQALLVVSDLHLEKGSSYGVRRVFLPPYDTAATLARLAALIARTRPKTVVALGDSFHDGRGPSRLSAEDRATLKGLQRGRDWLWVAGNHDPEPPEDVGGHFANEMRFGPITFRHEPTGAAGEIAGHLHPVARLSGHGRAVSRRCFASDAARVVMPAFGAFTGGLNVRHSAFTTLFGSLAFTAHMLGAERTYAVSPRRCLPD